ncbi:N-acetyl sugar amidotransferase [Butyricimonas sp. Marseille-P3923]|uniref:N-acetyl sugar amidotransferase n=1 Tax=Butyricimonas sp. Marseille-P3923 TaxID=1987504 RepID=UPI000C0680E0|nr:N-acetyl sugar amidotransferase [Butyricimonas sp. Marseille-P3923]
MKQNEYKICSRCVMDNSSDPYIVFDENGHCNYCQTALSLLQYGYFPDKEGEMKLKSLIHKLKNEGQGKKYDCLMGISGGLDSAYLAYIGAVKWGLRICAIHIDDGFDTDLAINNIVNLCKSCNIELVNIQPDAQQFADLTKAFMRAEVPNIAIPQDNILFAILYKYAREFQIKYFLSGTNLALESILQKGNTYGAYDLYHIKCLHKKFGQNKINKLPLISQYRREYDRLLLGIKTVCPLDFIEYNKEHAITELRNFCGFEYYEAKHLENSLTKVIQLKWFAEKFHVDKRRSHLSSLIVSKQMSREEALLELEKPLCDKDKMEIDIANVLNKLGMSREEFNLLLAKPGKQHTDYPVDGIYPYFSKLLYYSTWLIKRVVNRK